jgi:CPA2 family monovalent cation:H+ antiporter-2
MAAELQAQQVPFVVAEQNRELVEALRRRNIPAVSGDAAEPEVLIQAHIARAAMLVITPPDSMRARRMVEIARTLNPKVQVLLRTLSEDEAVLLRQEGLGTVFLGKEELSRSMTTQVLDQMRPHHGSVPVRS